jgi:hypothetical protein
VVKIQSGGWHSILKGDCNPEKCIIWGINISLQVIELRKKKGSYSAVFKAVERKLWCFKFNLEDGLQSYREIAIQINISAWGINISLPGLAVFEAVQRKLWCLKFNLEAVLQSYREIAIQKNVSFGA